MNLEIHFYNKSNIAILTNTSEDLSLSSEEKELLLFAWFTLRQFSNLSHHAWADIFAGILDSVDIDEFVRNEASLPEAAELISNVRSSRVYRKKGFNSPEYKQIVVENAINKAAGTYTALDRELLAGIPQIVDYPGKSGNKRFIVKFPPGVLDMKGFGVLGLGSNLNYYVCHSIFALYRFLAIRHLPNKPLLERISSVAKSCSDAYVEGHITMANQGDLAAQFVGDSRRG